MDLTHLPLAELGASSILGMTVLMVFRGHLIPKRLHEERMHDKDQQIEYLRTALVQEQVRGSELTAQVGVLMEVAATAEHVLTSLPVAAGRTEGVSDAKAL